VSVLGGLWAWKKVWAWQFRALCGRGEKFFCISIEAYTTNIKKKNRFQASEHVSLGQKVFCQIYRNLQD